jgi:hypothetical protein
MAGYRRRYIDPSIASTIDMRACLYWLATLMMIVGIISVTVGVTEWWKWRKELWEDYIDGGGQA